MIWAPISLRAVAEMPQRRLLVYAALLSFQGKNKNCRVGTEAIAERIFSESGVNVTRNVVQKQINQLKKTGWIFVKRTGRTSIYQVRGVEDQENDVAVNGLSVRPSIRLIRSASQKADSHKRTL